MNKTVLVVDDEPDIQQILKAYLERIDGVEVLQALSGEDGVEIYRKLADTNEAPCMVVMDLNLSGSNADQEIVEAHRRGENDKMDGVATAKEIIEIDSDAVIWGYTAWAGTSWAARLDEAGAHRVIDRIVPFKSFVKQLADFIQQQ